MQSQFAQLQISQETHNILHAEEFRLNQSINRIALRRISW